MGTIRVNDSHIEKITNTCLKLLQATEVSARCLASFTGQIISMIPIVEDLARFHTRYSQIAVAAAPTWDSFVTLSTCIKNELQFWVDSIVSLNLKHVFEVSCLYREMLQTLGVEVS